MDVVGRGAGGDMARQLTALLRQNVAVQTWTDTASHEVTAKIFFVLFYMFIRQTVPLPLVPSNTKKLAIGASRAVSAFRMSCASIPPTTAHTGANS